MTDYTVFLPGPAASVCQELARAIAGDGEGASRLITCAVREARSEESAERLAKAVVGSPLVKAAMFGADANWGRVLCAMRLLQGPLPTPSMWTSPSPPPAGAAVVLPGRHGVRTSTRRPARAGPAPRSEVVIDVDLHEGRARGAPAGAATSRTTM